MSVNKTKSINLIKKILNQFGMDISYLLLIVLMGGLGYFFTNQGLDGFAKLAWLVMYATGLVLVFVKLGTYKKKHQEEHINVK